MVYVVWADTIHAVVSWTSQNRLSPSLSRRAEVFEESVVKSNGQTAKWDIDQLSPHQQDLTSHGSAGGHSTDNAPELTERWPPRGSGTTLTRTNQQYDCWIWWTLEMTHVHRYVRYWWTRPQWRPANSPAISWCLPTFYAYFPVFQNAGKSAGFRFKSPTASTLVLPPKTMRFHWTCAKTLKLRRKIVNSESRFRSIFSYTSHTLPTAPLCTVDPFGANYNDHANTSRQSSGSCFWSVFSDT